jgi:hypothetical protein
MLLIRDRKDPRRKNGNDQRIPLLHVSGYGQLLTNNEGLRGAIADAYFHTTEDRSGQPSADNAEN